MANRSLVAGQGTQLVGEYAESNMKEEKKIHFVRVGFLSASHKSDKVNTTTAARISYAREL